MDELRLNFLRTLSTGYQIQLALLSLYSEATVKTIYSLIYIKLYTIQVSSGVAGRGQGERSH